MGVLPFGVILFCALVGPSHQLLTVPDSCSVALDPSTRTTCGAKGITRESCLDQGCCFDESCMSAASPGVCYKPPNCESVAAGSHKNIGWAGISRQLCNCRGGCFDDSNANVPSCFEPNTVSSCEMRKFEKSVIVNNNYKEVRSVTEEECVKGCSADSKCKTAEYHTRLSRCWYSEKVYEDAVKETLVRSVDGFTLYAICPSAEPAVPPQTTPDICAYEVHDGTFVVNYNFGNLLRKMTIDECKHECNIATEAKCEGIEYNKKSQRCFLSSITYAEGKHKTLIRSFKDFVFYSCPYTGPPLTTAAPPVTVPPTEPPVVTDDTLTECIDKQVDLFFVLDESSSIIPEDFLKIKAFTEGVVKKLPISPRQTKVGCITFSSSPTVRFTLHHGTTATKANHLIKQIDQRGGNTFTHTALQRVVELMKKANGGRDGAKKVIIIETDGASKNSKLTKEAAEAARAEGITIIAIGVGNYDATEISNIASDPDSGHVFKVPDFDQLFSLVKDITISACKDAPPSSEEPLTTLAPRPSNVPPFCKDIPVANRTENPPLYMIDPDGSNKGADPFRVECDFSGNTPVTIIHNKQEKRSCANECSERNYGCFVQTIQYLGSIFQVKTAVNLADSCSQHIQFDCFNAALDYRTHDSKGPFTYWTNYKGKKMNFWPGGASSGGCACGKDDTCATKSEKCNCDSKDGVWRSDAGTITDQSQLPVKEIAVGDVSKAGQQGCYTAGPLKCI